MSPGSFTGRCRSALTHRQSKTVWSDYSPRQRRNDDRLSLLVAWHSPRSRQKSAHDDRRRRHHRRRRRELRWAHDNPTSNLVNPLRRRLEEDASMSSGMFPFIWFHRSESYQGPGVDSNGIVSIKSSLTDRWGEFGSGNVTWSSFCHLTANRRLNSGRSRWLWVKWLKNMKLRCLCPYNCCVGLQTQHIENCVAFSTCDISVSRTNVSQSIGQVWGLSATVNIERHLTQNGHPSNWWTRRAATITYNSNMDKWHSACNKKIVWQHDHSHRL